MNQATLLDELVKEDKSSIANSQDLPLPSYIIKKPKYSSSSTLPTSQVSTEDGEADIDRSLESQWQVQSCQHQIHARNSLDSPLDRPRLPRRGKPSSSQVSILVLILIQSSLLSSVLVDMH